MLNYDLLEKFVINLKRRPDRLKIFQEGCPLKCVNVVYGYDGRNPSESKSAREHNMVHKFSSLNIGEIGCFISHLRIFQMIIENNYSFTFIMEDDAIFCEGFEQKLLKVLNDMPADTDLLYIGGRFTKDFVTEKCLKISDVIVKHGIDSNIRFKGDTDLDRTTHAYIISYKMAKMLLDMFYSSGRISKAIDSWILQACHTNSISIYNAQPLLCHSPIIGDSDIRIVKKHVLK